MYNEFYRGVGFVPSQVSGGEGLYHASTVEHIEQELHNTGLMLAILAEGEETLDPTTMPEEIRLGMIACAKRQIELLEARDRLSSDPSA
jgi:hypothetical protein